MVVSGGVSEKGGDWLDDVWVLETNELKWNPEPEVRGRVAVEKFENIAGHTIEVGIILAKQY